MLIFMEVIMIELSEFLAIGTFKDLLGNLVNDWASQVFFKILWVRHDIDSLNEVTNLQWFFGLHLVLQVILF